LQHYQQSLSSQISFPSSANRLHPAGLLADLPRAESQLGKEVVEKMLKTVSGEASTEGAWWMK
jgi:hypothetical protein